MKRLQTSIQVENSKWSSHFSTSNGYISVSFAPIGLRLVEYDFSDNFSLESVKISFSILLILRAGFSCHVKKRRESLEKLLKKMQNPRFQWIFNQSKNLSFFTIIYHFNFSMVDKSIKIIDHKIL